jgi:GAF domain
VSNSFGIDLIRETCDRAERMVRETRSRTEALGCLIAAAEATSGDGAVSSILVLDGSGLLRNGASPNLPTDYLQAIDGLKPDPGVGTCAAAAATGSVVITRSFLADDKWQELRHLPLALGFVGAWSMPIKSQSDGRVLGTFGTYYRTAREPTEQEISTVQQLVSSAARVLDSP